MERLTRVEICCATHDHATDPSCKYHVKEAIIELTDEEMSVLEENQKIATQRRADEEAARAAYQEIKASAKAKLVAGQPLTPEEADTLVI